MACIALIDDDPNMDILVSSLRFRGHEAYRVPSALQALRDIETIVASDLVILDIIMTWPQDNPTVDALSTGTSGMEVFREIRRRNRNLPVVAFSAIQDASVIDALADDPCTSVISKWETPTLHGLIRQICNTLRLPDELPRARPFIVHGQDEKAKLALKNYLQNTLHFPEPVILHEQPGLGRTIIEKFEDYAANCSIVFVLLTPDDLAASGSEKDDDKRRARQNVIFEMGYFLGMLGRNSGRVLLLYRGPLELPSDLAGVVYIDISQGIEAAGEKIRREVENVRL
jgi:CheY-like chemotaxis protein